MKKIAWATDIHLNFLSLNQARAFIKGIAREAPDALLLAGDIGEADSVEAYLRMFEDELRLPVYFILGNHDFYRGSILDLRRRIQALVERSRRLHWLTNSDVVALSERSCLIGCDSWSDGRLGDYKGSGVMLNDYFYIKELRGLDKEARLEKLHELGDEAAAHLRRLLPRALARHRRVLVLIHAPPFKEACWHEGKPSEDDFLPHFSCKAAGDVLVEMMEAHPDRRMTVLCGHTHGGGVADILPNLRVLTGAAVYGRPHLQEMLDIP
ncbi:MAG: phosphoesterase [Desulfobacterales bacterium]|nr:phosphoesterase [Desulfobacterales bacterium]